MQTGFTLKAKNLKEFSKMGRRDEKVANAKKPIFKKWWFWLIIVIVIAGAVGGSKSTPKKVSDSSNSKTSSAKKEKQKTTFKVGETVEIDGVHLTVNSVNFSEGSQYSKPKDGNQYVLVNVTIENKSKKTTNYNPFDFKLDDAGNQTALSEYIMNEDGSNPVTDALNSGTLAEGGKVTGTMVGQAKKDGKYKLIYTGNMFLNESKITVELN